MKRVIAVGVLGCIALGLGGCGAPSDPVENLKWHLERAVKDYNSQVDESKKIDASALQYDVRKTDSLVAPFEAVVVCEMRGQLWRANYAHKEGNWTFVSAELFTDLGQGESYDKVLKELEATDWESARKWRRMGRPQPSWHTVGEAPEVFRLSKK